jgi:hypothetical protein
MIQRNRKNNSPKLRELIVSENLMKVTPDLFEHSLINELHNKVGLPMEITLTDNKKRMISVRKEGQWLFVRLSKIFTLADDDLISDLAHYISGKANGLPARVRYFINSQPPMPNRGKRSPGKITTAGKSYNLRIIARRLNEQYFSGKLPVRLTWGRAPTRVANRRRRSRSILYGSYDGILDLIRIHPALDSLNVPIEFIESVVYHEMLHKKLGITNTVNGRRRLHTPEFKKLEREYVGFSKAMEWEKKNFINLVSGASNWAI